MLQEELLRTTNKKKLEIHTEKYMSWDLINESLECTARKGDTSMCFFSELISPENEKKLKAEGLRVTHDPYFTYVSWKPTFGQKLKKQFMRYIARIQEVINGILG